MKQIYSPPSNFKKSPSEGMIPKGIERTSQKRWFSMELFSQGLVTWGNESTIGFDKINDTYTEANVPNGKRSRTKEGY